MTDNFFYHFFIQWPNCKWHCKGKNQEHKQLTYVHLETSTNRLCNQKYISKVIFWKKRIWDAMFFCWMPELLRTYIIQTNWSRCSKYTTKTTTILWLFVQDYPGQPVPEETFTHSHLSWSSTILYQLSPSTTIHSIAHVQCTCLIAFFIFCLNVTHPSEHLHFCPLKCHLIFFPHRTGLTSMQHITSHTTGVVSVS